MGGTTTPIDANSMPGVLPAKVINEMKKYRVRYQKFNLDDLADVAELEKIETKGVRDEGVFIMSKKDFIFMDKIFMLVNYLELVPTT